MNPLTYFKSSVSGHNTVAGSQASHGGTINFNFNGSAATAGEASRVPPKPFSTVPFPQDEEFVDRPTILNWMREKCARPAARIALVGLGGVGFHPNSYVFWAHASSRERFEEGYETIAERLQLPGRHDPEKNLLQLVSNWLRDDSNGNWYMFVDNADDANMFFSTDPPGLASFLPTTSHGTVVITSRSVDAAEGLTGSHKNIYQVPAMENGEAYQLLLEKLEDECYDEEAAADLTQVLENIPLAITQAAAFINRRAPRMSLSTYLDDFQKNDSKKSSLLNVDVGDLRRDRFASNSIVTTWQMTFEQIKNDSPGAADLLCFMSFFNSHGIPEYVLKAYADEKQGSDLNEDIEVLRGYALITVTVKENTYEMHALVQFCTKVWLSSFDDMVPWKMEHLRILSNLYPTGSYNTWVVCQELNPHIEGALAEKPDDSNDVLRWAHLLLNVGWYWSEKGRYRDAEVMMRQTVEARSKILGEADESTLESISLHGTVLVQEGKYQEAEKAHRQAQAGLAMALGKESRLTLQSTMDLAGVLRRQRKLEEAEKIYQEILEITKRVFGAEDSDTMRALNGFALTLGDLGKAKEAEHILRQSMDIYLRAHGPDHQNTLISILNITNALGDQGQYAEAEKMCQEALGRAEKVLGVDDPTTLDIRYNQAYFLWEMFSLEKAYENSEIGYHHCMRAFGPDHKVTKDFQNLSLHILGGTTP